MYILIAFWDAMIDSSDLIFYRKQYVHFTDNKPKYEMHCNNMLLTSSYIVFTQHYTRGTCNRFGLTSYNVYQRTKLSIKTERTFAYTVYEPVHEKTNNMGFRPGPTQTKLYSDSIKLET